MKLGQVTLGMLALLALLIAPLGEVAGQTQVQKDAVTGATSVYAAGAPHGSWQQLIEPVRFYMDGTPTTGGLDAPDAALTYVPPTGDARVVRIGNAGIDFAMVANQVVSAATTLHRVNVAFSADCLTAVGLPTDPEFVVTLSGMDFKPATGDQPDSALVAASGGPGSSALYATTFDYPAALNMPLGTVITVNVAPSVEGVTCGLDIHQEGSRVTFFTESANVNMWTAAKSGSTPGSFIRSVPHASKVLPAQRAFEVHVAYTSAWPCLNGDKTSAGAQAGYTCAAGNPGSDVISKAFEEGRLGMRVRNLDTAAVQTAGTVIGAVKVTQLADGAEARTRVISYDNQFQNGAFSTAEGAKAGRFAFEIFSALDFVSSNTLSVGGKGFTFAPVGVPERSINVGEPTTYRLLVKNIGTERDTITVSLSSDDAAWNVNVLNGQVTVEPAGQAEVLVRVTPPAQGVPGDAVQLTARAVSSFPNEVQPITQVLKVAIVSAVTSGAVLTGPTTALEVSPGQQLDLSGFKLRNLGTAVGTYVIETSYAPAAQGWRADATPASRTIDAASVDDFSLKVTVAPNAAPGESHVLRVQARLLGGGVPDAAKLEIPFSVVFKAGLDITQRDVARDLRDDASTTAPAFTDNDNDHSAVFRMTLANPTAVAQRFNVKNTWLDANSEADSGNPVACNDSHKGWKLAMSADGAFAAVKTMDKTLTLPGSAIVDVYFALAWADAPTGCTAVHKQKAGIVFQSLDDTDFKETVTIDASITDAGTAVRAPVFELARKIDGVFQKTEVGAVRAGTAFSPATFDFFVINDGNELDSYTIELPTAPNQGWTHKLSHLTTQSVGHATAASCTSTFGDRVLKCTNVGVGDHLRIRLTVQPPSNEALGRTMTSSIIITSGDDADYKDFATLRTRTVGQNEFTLESLRGQPTNIAKGQTAALPFQIRNVGTAGDAYTLAITAASSDTSAWKPRFSGSVGGQQEISVPGGSDYNGFLLVQAPSGSAVSTNSEHSFTLQVTSSATNAKKSVTLAAKVVDAVTDPTITGKSGNSFLLAKPGLSNDITVVFSSGTACEATLTADVDSLPEGWRVTAGTGQTAQTTAAIAGSGTTKSGEAVFKVTPPADTLGTSYTAMRVIGQCPGGATAYTDIIMSVEVQAGVDLALVSPNVQFVTPGGPTRWEMDVVNSGLDGDTIRLSTSALPPGWSVDFESRSLYAGPIDTVRTTFDVLAPADAAPRANVTFNVLATSQRDASVIKQVTVSAVVGFRDIMLTPAAARLDGAPEQAVGFVVPVTNAGTLSDKIQMTATVLTPGYENQVKARVSPATVELVKGQVRDVVVTVDVGRTVPADVDIAVKLVATSVFSPTVNTTKTLTVHILRFERADIDGDLVDEYAVDRNKNAADGFEEFRDSTAPGGRQTLSADLARFLNAAGKAALQTSNLTTPFIDGDKDGKRDHFLDDTGDGLPNIYWDPDNKHSMRLSIAKDVDADAVIDYFVDTSGNGRLDRLYNVVTGKWTSLIAIDGDGGRISYVVDSNENGRVDANESILVVSLGRVASVTVMVDVDGDGKLDTVVDEDGDGTPDFFIRAGETRERRIIMQDVNGDGIEDWTYDSNLDGRADSYYDPAAKTGGHEIDRAAHFGDMVKNYWYVPVLFLLVAVLFVVLIAVTRR